MWQSQAERRHQNINSPNWFPYILLSGSSENLVVYYSGAHSTEAISQTVHLDKLIIIIFLVAQWLVRWTSDQVVQV